MSIRSHAFGPILVALLALILVGTASAAPSTAPFSNGSHVQVGNGAVALNVRYGPGMNHGVVTVIRLGAIARVIAGPVYVGGHPWYQVAGFDLYGSYGWSYGGYLVPASSYQGTTSIQRVAPVQRTQRVPVAAPASGPTYDMLATGYNGAEFGSNGIMRNGNYVRWGAVAVDPSVIPLGTRMYISGFGNQVFVAEDTGSAIIGNRIDIWMPSVGQALEFAAQRRTVTIIR